MKNKSLASLAVPLGVVGIVLLLVVPLPPALLDIFIAANVTLGLVIVIATMYIRRSLDFASFPSLLLIATLFRLALNISATRLVLRRRLPRAESRPASNLRRGREASAVRDPRSPCPSARVLHAGRPVSE